jgi:RimJ/RimL family protein N-acetyltransferase
MIMHSITLREINSKDLSLLLEIELDAANQVHTTHNQPTEEELISYLNSIQDFYSDGQVRFVIDVDGVGVGFVDLSDASIDFTSVATGIIVKEEWRKQGIGLKAMDLLSIEAKRLKIKRMLAFILPENIPSIHLFHQAGFIFKELVGDFNLYVKVV